MKNIYTVTHVQNSESTVRLNIIQKSALECSGKDEVQNLPILKTNAQTAIRYLNGRF